MPAAQSEKSGCDISIEKSTAAKALDPIKLPINRSCIGRYLVVVVAAAVAAALFLYFSVLKLVRTTHALVRRVSLGLFVHMGLNMLISSECDRFQFSVLVFIFLCEMLPNAKYH